LYFHFYIFLSPPYVSGDIEIANIYIEVLSKEMQ
jgi:hypothetical protein